MSEQKSETMFVLHRVVNGWIVSRSEYLFTKDLPDLHVFTSMRELASHLIKASGEKVPKMPKRDKKGHFLKSV